MRLALGANAPVLLISGRDEDVWPSTYMAEQVVERLRRHAFPHPVTHLAYDDAGHAIGRPHYRMFPGLGGTPSGNARARAEHWEAMASVPGRQPAPGAARP